MHKSLYYALFAAALFYFSYDHSPAVDSKQLSKAGFLRIGSANERVSSQLTSANFEDVIRGLYDSIDLGSYGLGYHVFRMGMVGFYTLKSEGALNDKGLITIIDFEKPSTAKRFYTIDVLNKRVKYHTYVAHGRNTGENMATRFSNTPHSNQSSLGFYVTGETYVGSKGFSLRLDGKEAAFNDKIRSRAVVIHAADYATESWIRRYGRLGRSQGCPALPPHLNREIINAIKDKTPVFTYFPDSGYIRTSRYLKEKDLFRMLDKNPVQLVANARS